MTKTPLSLALKIVHWKHCFTAFLKGATNNIVHNGLSTAFQARLITTGVAIPGISTRNNTIVIKNRHGIIATHIGQAAYKLFIILNTKITISIDSSELFSERTMWIYCHTWAINAIVNCFCIAWVLADIKFLVLWYLTHILLLNHRIIEKLIANMIKA